MKSKINRAVGCSASRHSPLARCSVCLCVSVITLYIGQHVFMIILTVEPNLAEKIFGETG